MNLKKLKFAMHAGLTAALLAVPVSLSAQDKTSIVPEVPASDWRQVSSQTLPLSDAIKFHGDPVVENEYGVKTLELRTYQLGKGQAQVLVEPAADATSAYGLLTFYQSPLMLPEKDIQLAVSDSHQTLMARGSNFLRFLRDKNESFSDKQDQSLLLFVGGSKPSASVLRSLPSPMPVKGLLPGTEKYLLGLETARRVLPDFRTDLLGLDESAEVQLGEYKTGKGVATLISISYPTPQMARIRFGALSSFLALNQPKGDASAYGVRHGSYVFLVLKADKQETANSLLKLFQVTQGLSWDQKYVSERSFTLQLVHMFLAIFLLTAFLLGGCLVAGVGFFLSRRFAARFFPNSQWGHADDEQLIRLNIKF